MKKTLVSKWWLWGLVLALLLAFLSPLASASPDGLERVAEDKGFIEKAREAPFSIMADYLFPGLENEALATVVSGVIGTAIVFGLGLGLAWLLRSRRGKYSESELRR